MTDYWTCTQTLIDTKQVGFSLVKYELCCLGNGWSVEKVTFAIGTLVSGSYEEGSWTTYLPS